MSYRIILLLITLTPACITSKKEKETEKFELIFKDYKKDLAAGTCTVTAEVEHVLPDGTINQYTLKSTKNSCEEAESDIRKGYEALKKAD